MHRFREATRRGAVILGLALALPVAAQEAAQDPAATKERKNLERQQRQEEYLRKKAEKQAREFEEAAAADPSTYRGWRKYLAESGMVSPAAAGTSAPSAVRVNPKDLRDNQERLLAGPLGADPDTAPYLQRIEAGQATPAEVAAFGTMLARLWYLADAVDYYETAIDYEPGNADMLLNLGSVQLRRENLGGAESAFREALDVDPNNARAYYSLGAVHRRAGRYDEALEAFVTALVLDPSLGDPKSNPQVLNNDLALPVKMLVYERTVGGLGLPLVTIQGGEIPVEATAPTP